MTVTSIEFSLDVLTDHAWERRITADRESAWRLVPKPLRPLHATVIARATEAGAKSLILSGSTARGSRTEISDVDYHLVGDRIPTRDLSMELDLHVLTPQKLTADILSGDDFVQWSIRFGLVLFDDGTVLTAARLIAGERPWPNVERKAEHACKSLDLARRVVESGDHDGALIQVRTALTLAARAYLLSIGLFPLSRAELPSQLVEGGQLDAAALLDMAIRRDLSLEVLDAAVSEGLALLDLSETKPGTPRASRSTRGLPRGRHAGGDQARSSREIAP